MRTIISYESFHTKLNEMFYSSYLNIFRFLEVQKNIQTDIYIKMRSSNLTNKRREGVEKEGCIKNTLKKKLKSSLT